MLSLPQSCSVFRTEQVQCTFAPPYKAKLTYFTQQIAREDNALSALHLMFRPLLFRTEQPCSLPYPLSTVYRSTVLPQESLR